MVSGSVILLGKCLLCRPNIWYTGRLQVCDATITGSTERPGEPGLNGPDVLAERSGPTPYKPTCGMDAYRVSASEYVNHSFLFHQLVITAIEDTK